MKLARRHFLMAGAGGAVALTGCGLVAFPAQLETGIIASVRRSFPDLVMADSDLQNFAQQLSISLSLSANDLRMTSYVLNYLPLRQVASTFRRELLRRMCGKIAGEFLRTTNYLDPARGSEAVALVSSVDPYEGICCNMVSVFQGQTLTWPEPTWLAAATT